MSFIREWHSSPVLRLATLGAMVALGLLVWSALGTVGAYEGTFQTEPSTMPPAQGSGDPEANLPFLFAVYIITWAAFFAYVFYVSRRQREMQGEIEALKRALEERDRQAAENNE